MLPTRIKKKAGLVEFYLHAHRKKLGLVGCYLYTFIYKEKSWDLLDVIYIHLCTKKKAGLVGCYLHL